MNFNKKIPENFIEERVAGIDGWPLRTLRWAGAGKKGTIIFLNGRADFIEKYYESYHSLLSWGYDLLTFDWRGQGLSGRLSDSPDKGHQRDFGQWIDDLNAVLNAMHHKISGPFHLIAHSMGAHLALRFMHARPNIFRKAVLLAPMLGINTQPLPRLVVRRLAAWKTQRGQGQNYALTQGPYGPAMRSVFRQTRLTSDAGRFAEEGAWIDQNPELALGGVTYGWLNAAFHSIDILFAPGYLETIGTDILMILPEDDQLIDRSAVAEAAHRLPQAELIQIAGGRHELLREADSVRIITLDAIHHFLEQA